MAVYRLELRRSAAKELDRIEPLAVRRKLVARIRALGQEPRPPGVEKLAGQERSYRLRQGDYRIVYEVDDPARLVTIAKVGHRREVYR
ncbi:MAG: type II toxin-antitoxin system RelE/ParE family toxin [Thermoanaerobaculia bacterium]